MPIAESMTGDDAAVGGFFEDLPVLAFVLAGVLSVSGTAVWANDVMSDSSEQEAIDRLASLLVSEVTRELSGVDGLPTVKGVQCANLSETIGLVAEGASYLVSVWCLHPEMECLLRFERYDGEPRVVGAAHSLLNAIREEGIVEILEVRGLVWLK